MKEQIKLNIDLDFCDEVVDTIMSRMRFRVFQMLESIEGNSLNLEEMFNNGKDCNEETPMMVMLPVYGRYACIKQVFIWEDKNGVKDVYFDLIGMEQSKLHLCKLSYKELYGLCRFIQHYI